MQKKRMIYDGLRLRERRNDDPKWYNSFVIVMQVLGVVAYAVAAAGRGFVEQIAAKVKAPPKKIA